MAFLGRRSKVKGLTLICIFILGLWLYMNEYIVPGHIDLMMNDGSSFNEDDQLTLSKTVVMGKLMSENVSWVANGLPDWRPAIYAVDDPESKEYLTVAKNKGREAMAYLTYMIDFYDDLSDINVFVHAHEGSYPRAWHNEPDIPQNIDYKTAPMLNFLRLNNVRKNGYVNLRCNGKPGCPAGLQPSLGDFKSDSVEIGWIELWKHLYKNKPVPAEVGVACCAQFAVSKARIREKPKKFYQSLMEWFLKTDSNDPGRVFEYFWHIIFGMPYVYCDDAYYDCICRTFSYNSCDY